MDPDAALISLDAETRQRYSSYGTYPKVSAREAAPEPEAEAEPVAEAEPAAKE